MSTRWQYGQWRFTASFNYQSIWSNFRCRKPSAGWLLDLQKTVSKKKHLQKSCVFHRIVQYLPHHPESSDDLMALDGKVWVAESSQSTKSVDPRQKFSCWTPRCFIQLVYPKPPPAQSRGHLR